MDSCIHVQQNSIVTQQFFAGRKRLKICFTKKEHHHHNEVWELEADPGVTHTVRSPRSLHRWGWGGDCNGGKLERSNVQCAQPDLAWGHACVHFSCKAWFFYFLIHGFSKASYQKKVCRYVLRFMSLYLPTDM